jgi:N-acetyl sugar amidotransferase
MDTSDINIRFDNNGICDHCNTFYNITRPRWNVETAGEHYLDSLVAQIKQSSKNAEFDCLIGMSGGIDSSYLVYAATELLGLKPLVFHVDAGWNSQIAVHNIERLVDGLNLELYTEVINWEEMKDLQISFFKSGVPHIDTPQDHAFFATMYKFAAKYGIKNILTGANLSTECIRNPLEWMYYQSDCKQLRDIHRLYGNQPLKTFPVTSIIWHKIWLPYIKGIRVHRPLDHMNYIKDDAKNLLIKRFGWEPYPQKHFESRFTKFYESFWLPERFGYDVRKVQYSSLIVTGQMSRDEALDNLEKPTYDKDSINYEIEFVANKLDISVSELLGYMKLPLKSYKDYNNQANLYQIGAKAMKYFGLEVGGKR